MSRSNQKSSVGGNRVNLYRQAIKRAVRSTLEKLEERRLFALPVADAGGPYTVAEGGTVLISGLNSTDDGSIASYQWDTNYSAGRGFRPRFTGTKWNFTAADSGSRTIALRVTDDEGGQHTVTQTISITDVAPTLSLTAPNNAAEGQPVNVSWSYTDPGQSDTVTQWAIDWGDGATETFAGNITSASHAYAEDGAYVIELTSTQADATTSVTHNITIDNEAPQVDASTTTPSINEGAAVDLSFSSPNRSATIEGWVIDWGDGNIDVLPANHSSATHTYGDSGNYTATISALEPDGGTGSATVNYAVANLAPGVVMTGVPATGDEGDAITVGSTVTDAADDTHVYGWTVYRGGTLFTLPGGTVVNQPTFTFTPTDNGSYVIRLTVVDDEGGSTTVNSDPIVVGNVAPTATITGAPVGNINEGTAVNLSAVPADAGTEDSFTYAWSVTKDGSAYDLQGAATDEINFSFTPRDNGAYIATVVVTDDDGAQVSVATAAITVDNVNPVASIVGVPGAQPDEGDTIPLSAGVTDAGADDTHTYAWSVTKDGQPYDLTGVTTDEQNFAFVPDDNADYVVTLTVTDDDTGAHTVSSAAITVNNLQPIPTITGNTEADEGDTVSLGHTKIDRGSADTHTYLWSVTKDGQPYDLTGVTVDQASFEFVPTDNGSYVASLTVTDDDGGAATTTHTITVANLPPTVQQDNVPATGDEGSAITIDSTVSDAGSADVLTYGWTVYRDGQQFVLPGGTTLDGQSFTFTPTDDGNYVVRLTVVDDDGGSTTVNSDPIVISNVAPTATINNAPVGNINEGDTVNLTVTPADAGSEDTFTYAWSVTKGGSSYDLQGATTDAAAFDFTPRDNGTYVVTVVVTDDDGGAVSVSTAAITVDNVAPVATVIDEPATANEGDTVTANAHYIDTPDDTVTYAWTVTKDGQPYDLTGVTTDESTFAFVPSDNGTYVIGLTVTDDDGGSHAVTSDNIVVSNVAPTGVVTGDDTADEGATVNYSIAVTDPGSADTQTYLWSVTKDSQPYDLTGITVDQSSFSFAPNDNGAYVVSVTVTDDDGDANTYTHNLTVANAAPVGTITGAPAQSDEGTQIDLDRTVTDAGSVDTHTYAWSVTKDGQSFGAAGANATYSFTPDDNAEYVVTLVTTDNDGASHTTTASITVNNVAPVVTVAGEPVGNINEGVQVDLTTGLTDVGSADTHTYSWSVTKGGVAYVPGVATNTGTLSFTPRDNGTYVATVTVTDDDGGQHVVASQDIIVDNVDPVASIDNMPVGNVNEGTGVTVDAGVTDAGADDTHTYAWSVTKDGQPFDLTGVTTDAAQFTFIPNDNGSYVITLTVTDDDAGTTTVTSAAITVDNVAPTGVLSGDTEVAEGATASYSVTVTDPGSADTQTYLWSVTKDGQPYDLTGITVDQPTFSFAPNDNGAYVVSVTVTDDDAGTNTYTENLTVTNLAPTVQQDNVPATGNEGAAITIDSTVSDAGSADTLTYGWTVYRDGQHFVLPGGTTLDGQSFTFTPTDDGNYVVRLTVVDDDGGSTTVNSDPIVISNVAPTATINNAPVGNINEGDTVNLTVTPADAGSEDTFTYAWSVTKDGSSYDLQGATTDAAAFDFTPRDNGTYVVTVVVTDDDGGAVSVSTAAITVDNVAPVGAITGAPVGNPNEGDTISLGSTTTDAGADDTHTYAWTVTKDGQPYDLTGVTTDASTFAFVPNDNGDYVVTLVVTDDDGATDTQTTAAITVDNVAPAGVVTGDDTADEGATVNYSIAVTDPGSADTQTYLWSVTKDGQPYDLTGITVDQPSFAFVPNDNGAYVVSVTVTDDDGDANTYTHNLAVANVAPTVTIAGAATADEGDTVSLTATPADAGSADTFTYLWSVTKDGQAYDLTGVTVDQASFDFVPVDEGEYVATVVVTDDDGATGTIAHTVTVANVDPVISITGTPVGNVNEGDAITLGSTATDAGATDVLSYAWSVTKDGQSYDLTGVTIDANSLTFTPTDNGTYIATLVVTDEDGGTATIATAGITVVNVDPVGTITGAPVGNVDEGDTVSLGSTVTDAGAADTHTYAWSVTKDGQPFDVGAVATGEASFAFVPTDNGSYVVSLTVTDDDAGSHTVTTAAITVDNVDPAPTIAGDAAVDEASPITLTASPNDAGAADTHTYLWSVTKDGQPYDLTGVTVDAASFTFTPASHGAYVASVTVTDDDGASASATHNITVANLPPAVTLAGTPSGVRAEGYVFNMSASAVDPGGDTTFTYLWSVTRNGVAFDHQATATNATFMFEATDNGTYVISCAVTDTGGATGTATTSNVLITNALPNGVMNNVPVGPVNENTPIALSISADDPGAEDVLSYAWSVTKDGQSYDLTGVTLDEANFTFTPTDNGTYVVRVVITDDDGGATTVNSAAISVVNAPPTADITGEPTQAELEGLLVQLASDVTDPSPNDTHTYLWSVTRDGQPVSVTDNTSATFSFTATDNGDYTVSLTVTDDDGAAVTVSSDTFTITNAAPTATVSGPATAVEGDSVTLTTSVTDAGAEDTFTYAWSATLDGQPYDLTGVTTDEANFTFAPADNGAYVITAVITDDDGGSVTVTHNLSATNAAPTASVSGPDTGDEGSELTYSVTVSDPGSADTHTYAWSVTKDGQPYDLTGVTVDQATFSFTPDDNATYVVLCTVTDDDGAVGTGNKTVEVANVNPTAAITGLPVGTVDEGTTISLGSTASDAGDDTLEYTWSVTKDGQPYTPQGLVTDQPTFEFTPNDNGSYIVTLQVNDEDAGFASVTAAAITVTNVAPVAGLLPHTDVGSEGSTVSLSGTVSDAGSADTHTYLWTVTRNGQPYAVIGATGQTFDFVPDDNGGYLVTLTVTDDDGDSDQVVSDLIVVGNIAPTGTLTGDSDVTEGASAAFNVTVTDPGAADTFTYAWSVTKGGQPYELTGVTTDASTFTFNPNDNGVFVVTVTVTDDDGGTNSYSTNLAVSNVNPTVQQDNIPATGVEGSAITVGSTATDAGSADTLIYGWTVYRDGQHFMLPGGTTLDQPSFTFTPTDEGNYALRLTVVDDDGGSTTVNSPAIAVANANPSGTISGEPGQTDEGQSISLSVAATDAGANDTLSYSWSVTKDGQSYDLTGVTTDSAGFTFTPDDNGTYVATVVVTDNDGGSTSIASQAMTVNNVSPLANFNPIPTTGDEGAAISVESTSSDDGAADTFTYTWSVTKDGQAYDLTGVTTDAAAFSFTPNDNGTYKIILNIVDDDGASDTFNGPDITVANVAPTGTISGPTTGTEGASVTLTASATDAGSADTIAYSWSVTKDGSAYDLGAATTDEAALTFTPDDNATYVATCVVTDDDGGSVSLTHSVAVANANPVASITGAPTTGLEGTAISVGSTSSDAGADTLTYGWTIRFNGTPIFPDGVALDGESLSFVPSDNGSYTLRLTVTDEDGGSTTVNTAAIAVGNVAPIPVITGAPTEMDEATTATLGSSVTDAGSADQTAGFTYLWTAKRGETTVATGTQASFDFTPPVHGTYTVTLRAVDKDGGTTTSSTTTIVANNVAPSNVQIGGLPESMNEGEDAPLTASATDAPEDELIYSWSVKRNGVDFAGFQGPTFNFDPHVRGQFEITLTATDSADASTSATQTLTVDNLAPAASASSPASTLLLGENAEFGLTFSDEPPAQAITVTWNFGDGTTVTANYTGDQSNLVRNHTYTEAGAYNVTITVSDGVDQTVINKTVNVSRAAVRPDPLDATKTALHVLGTSSGDSILVAPVSGKWQVTLNGVVLGSDYEPNSRIYVKGNGGADGVVITGGLSALVTGVGNGSYVQTDSGNDIVVGSSGSEYVTTGAGRDILIGGAGVDTLRGGTSEDVLVSDSPAWSSDLAKIKQIADIWFNADTFTGRVNSMKATGLFSTSQIAGDGVQDQLYGESQSDWFVADLAIDRIRDWQAAHDLAN